MSRDILNKVFNFHLNKLKERFSVLSTVTCSAEVPFALLWQCLCNIVFITFRIGAKILTSSSRRKLLHTL